MDNIVVTIIGMVLLVSPTAYKENGTYLSAAVAPNGLAVKSAYGIRIPAHDAFLRVPTGVVDNIIGNKQRVQSAPQNTRIDLTGDYVAFGTFDGSNCKALTPVPIPEALSADVPQLDVVVDAKLRLKSGARPEAGDYSNIKPSLVAGWLDMPVGNLSADHSTKLSNDLVNFFPPNRIAMTSLDVVWKSFKADCVMVTPFKGSSSVGLVFKPSVQVNVEFHNAVKDKTSGDVIPNFGFDYEVLYSVLDNVPAIPPIPVSTDMLIAVRSRRQQLMDRFPQLRHQGHRVNMVVPYKMTTGIDCAPATLQPGTP